LVRFIGGATPDDVRAEIAKHPGPPGPPGPQGPSGAKVTNLIPERIGRDGIERPGVNPGMFSGTDSKTIPKAEGAPICTLSDIAVSPGAGSTCELHRDGNGWSITAMGGMQCRITCFRLE
jgi:hypothetical protein